MLLFFYLVMGGIIPACAGSTILMTDYIVIHWDHPRMRGEHCDPRYHPHYRQGSSPHARGARDTMKAAELTDGIIPACAGSTTCSRFCRMLERDHPRMRGEHFSR